MTLLARLLATPLAGARHHVDFERLVKEQASLRRVAALVERGVEPDVVFEAVAREAAALIGEPASLLKYEEEEGVYTIRAMSEGPLGVGLRVVYDPGCISWRVKRSGTCERIDDYDEVLTAKYAHELGLRAIVGAPINVDGTCGAR